MCLKSVRSGAVLVALVGALVPAVRAAQHVTLRNGFEYDCARLEAIDGDRFRLYLFPTAGGPADGGYVDVAVSAVSRVEPEADPVVAAGPAAKAASAVTARASTQVSIPVTLTTADMHVMLAKAGEQHDIDEDLLASVVKAESGGRVNAVSRTGAQGLMQLMPGTATEQGVNDAFKPDQNIAGGTAYLDALLKRYHDDVALALAAYNAGPGAVDRYHGIPPYRETRAYVARVIREFNRRKLSAAAAATMVAGTR
jgi:soluble lytic murein transglycosylase-like protein